MKSFTALETKTCIICGCEFDTGAVLLNKQLKPVFDNGKACTGWGMCDAHTAATGRDGMVALIEVDQSKSIVSPDGTITNENAFRTGRVLLVKREALQKGLLFRLGDATKFMFVDKSAVEKMFAPEVLADLPEETERTTSDSIMVPGTNTIN